MDRYIRHRPQGGLDEPAFSRFPTWMWRNEEVEGFVEWLRRHNGTIPDAHNRVGFYGLDLYNLRSSIAAVLDYLDRADPETARLARDRYGCLSPWQRDPAAYGEAALGAGFKACEKAVVEMLQELLKKRLSYLERDGEEWLDVQQNARLIAAAEEYYRTLYYGSTSSWNLRDRQCSRRFRRSCAARTKRQGGGLGAQLTYRQRLGDGDGPVWRVERRPTLPRGLRSDAALIGFGTDQGDGRGGVGLGRADGDQAGPPIPCGKL